MILSRIKPAVEENPPVSKKTVKSVLLEDYLSRRDYVGAITLLEFQRSVGQREKKTDLWLAYCAFHLGDYCRAMKEYKAMTERSDCVADVWVYLACSLFFLGFYKEANQTALEGPKCELQNRLLLHLAHKFNDEQKVLDLHKGLQDTMEDQLSLASIHYMHAHYREAIVIYKRVLEQCGEQKRECGGEERDFQRRDILALYVYVALCYFKMDYYDVSQQVLAAYLHSFPDSITALNLKACISFRIYEGKIAEAELKHLMEICSSSTKFARDLIKHNLVVFREGRGAVQELTPLLNVIPEARLNLIIFYLRHGEVQEAFKLVRDLEATTSQVQGNFHINVHQHTGYILKAATSVVMGQELNSAEHMKVAQHFFQLVGSSASECDTVPGRQCMASCLFLLKQFQDALIYLDSVKSYCNNDIFHFNYAQAKAAVGNYREAEESFLQIQNEKMKAEGIFLNWLARCYIMSGKMREAWELYLRLEPSEEMFSLLELIANDCYNMGYFYYSAKAFGVLEQLDPKPEYIIGKIGACVGVFQLVLARRESRQSLRKVLELLVESLGNKDVEKIIRVLKKWAADHHITL